MITVYEASEINFTTNGLGVITPLSCYLNVTINGAWVLELEHPYDAEEKYQKIAKDNIIKVTNIPIISEQTSSYQLFRIYDTVSTLTSIKAVAFPVAFEATYDAVIEELKTEKKTATATLQDVMTYLNQHGVTKYIVTSDYSMVETIRQRKGNWKNTNLIALISGGDDNSIINHWGGEVAYDNYKIIVNGMLGKEAEGLRVEHEEYLFNQTQDLCETTNENGWKFTFTKQNDNECLCAVVRNNDSPLERYYYQKIFFIAPLIEGYTAENVSWVYDVDYNTFHWEGENPIENDTESYSYIGDGYPVYRRAKFTSTFAYKGVTWIVWRGNIINTSTYNSYTPLTSVPVVNLPQITIDDDILSCKAIIDSAGAYIHKDDGNYEVRYGKNLAGLSVDVDMSSVVTRLYPVSKDGVRLSWRDSGSEVAISYVDAPHIASYPYIRSAFVEVDNQLVDTSFEVNQVNSDTAIATHTAQTTITNAIRTIASEMWSAICAGNLWNTKWYEPEWVQDVIDDVIKTLQAELPTTWNITHPTFKNLVKSCIKEGIEWIKKEEIADFEWDDSSGDWKYTNGSRTLTSQYAYIDRRYCYFNASGNYEPWEDVSSMDWIQGKTRNSKKKFGNNRRYYAQNETVYTMNGEHQGGSTYSQYYFDSDGWWDGTSEEAEWDWHQDGNKWWFGETGAEDNDNKYAHDCWLYIKASASSPHKRYYFDSDGYSVSELETSSDWDWRTKENRDYFGSQTKSQNAVYIRNQWLKVDGEWRKFGSDYYPVKNKILVDQITTLLKNALNNTLGGENGVIKIQSNLLYDVLYQHLKEYCGKMYEEENVDLPTETITVDIVELSEMKGYEDFSQFEQVHLGNSVWVHDYVHNFHLQERVVGLKYDCIRGYNTEVTISAPPKQIGQILTGGKSGGSSQETLVAGDGIEITNGVIGMSYIPSGDAFQGTQVIVEPQLVSGTKVADIYTDGTPHSIYAPSPTAYTAGANVQISEQNVISATDTKYTAGENVQISEQNVISATDTTYNDFAGSAHGLVPAVGSGDSGYLKTDGTWDEPEGTAVEANPSGTATGTLSTILIDDTIYDIQGGGQQEVVTDILANGNSWALMGTTNEAVTYGQGYGENDNINFLSDSQYDENTDRGQAVYTIPIPASVKKIRYKMRKLEHRTSSTDDMYKLCVGVKATLNTSTFSTPNDTDFIAKNLHSYSDAGHVDAELDVSSASKYYLYIIANSWHSFLYEVELVETVSGASNLDDLTDVNVSNPTAGQVLTYDGEKWINANPSGGLTAVELTKAQYDALPSEEKQDASKIYFITDYP